MSQFLQNFTGNTGNRLLYFQNFSYFRHRKNYWMCRNSSFKVTITTTGETINDDIVIPEKFTYDNLDEPQEQIRGLYIDAISDKHLHEPISPLKFEFIKTIQTIKQRAADEDTFLFTIYKEETTKLVTKGTNNKYFENINLNLSNFRNKN